MIKGTITLILSALTLAISITPLMAADRHLIEGVYALMDEGNPIWAEREFLLAVRSDPENPEPYYFLGMIRYGRGTEKDLQAALFYLKEAEKRGMRYDKLHPNLLKEIKGKYPNLKPISPERRPVQPDRNDVVELSFEAGRGKLISVSEDGRKMNVLSGEKVKLRCGRSYLIDVNRAGSIKRMFARITPLLALAAIWFIR
ncbi:TPA: hypothetical protein ENG04_04110 [Candidatus Poribacteria bacterium]|nr:hypothetical protein [Candidatus Poribacteria bacterium]HEX29245.1 hypothetical protein [Candidatus Poribacteria bacterium]